MTEPKLQEHGRPTCQL